jgi:nucleotide-binding universal stress UspA family protein
MGEARFVRERPILFCYDGSTESRRAIETARELVPSRRSVVLTVGSLGAVAEVYAAEGSGARDYDRELHQAVLGRAQEGAELARASGFAAEPRGELDVEIWRSIVDVARQLEACLIVLGSRGLHGLREVVEESVSHQVAVHAHRPVLIVPDPR